MVMNRITNLLAFLAITYASVTAATLDVYWVDVEGGAATLIKTPAGESILIDSGNPGNRDAGRIFEVATREAGLKKIDHLITTHFHGDHYGGAAMLANLIPIGIVHDNGIPAKNPDRHRKNPIFPQLIKPYRDMKVESRQVVKPGYVYPLKQAKGSAQIRVTCVAANQKIIRTLPSARLKHNPLTGTVPEKPEDLSDNANSVATLFSFGDFSFFDGGDLTWNVEAKLVTPFNLISPLVGKVDVFQINHHGLDSSNNPVLIRSLAPTVVVFNNGHKKGCNEGSFRTAKGTKSVRAIWQAHKNLRDDAHNNTEESLMANLTDSKTCKGHFIKLSVSADGKFYTILNSRNKEVREYKASR
jgi:competence protein ComEC